MARISWSCPKTYTAPATCLRLAVFLLCFVLLSPRSTIGQTEFAGKLDKGLHVDPTGLSPAIFNPISQRDAESLGIAAGPTDKIFSGEFALPKNGNLRYKAVIVRQSGGTDLLYVDKNRDGHLEPDERIAFRSHASSDPRLVKWAPFAVELPAGGHFRTCPMDVWLIREGVRAPLPVGPGQLAVAYTAQPFVQGYARLPKRNLQVRLEYDVDHQDIALKYGMEWIDINGDGKFDMTPGSGESLRAHGSAPIFTIGDLTLQMQSVELNRGRFVLRTLPRSADRRIPLSIGSIVPDFEFTDFTGAKHHLSDVKGRFVLLDFWAAWCAPCMEDLPILKKTYAELHPQGFEILAMDGDQTPENAEKAIRSMQLPWQQAQFDKDLLQSRFQISQWPTMVLLDAHRTILSIGEPNHLPLDGEHLAASLQALIETNR
jgi:thiol-disulfide isomerase/thioredoxin